MQEEHEFSRHSSSSVSLQSDLDRNGTTFSPIATPMTQQQITNASELHKISSRASRSSTNIYHTLSQTDGYSISVQGSDDEETEEEREGDDIEGKAGERDRASAADASATELVVRWDENDPENPKNMNRARKWLIAVIVSLGSVCVYVEAAFSQSINQSNLRVLTLSELVHPPCTQ